MLTAFEKLTCCQPLAVSLLKVALASKVAAVVHGSPIWVPVFCGALYMRVPTIVAFVVAWNLTPRSTALGSFSVTVPGVALGLNRLFVAGPPVILIVVV